MLIINEHICTKSKYLGGTKTFSKIISLPSTSNIEVNTIKWHDVISLVKKLKEIITYYKGLSKLL